LKLLADHGNDTPSGFKHRPRLRDAPLTLMLGLIEKSTQPAMLTQDAERKTNRKEEQHQ